jgi:hypothetical protein
LSGPRPTLGCPCSGHHLVEAFVYHAPPTGEIGLGLAGTEYVRAYDRCALCAHWFARHKIDLAALYQRGYVDATYGGLAGMQARLEQVLALPPERSDNVGRVARILAFAGARFDLHATGPRLLDIGAGIGVFPAAMKAAGWTVTAVEPDPRTAVHLRETVGVEAHAVPVDSLTATEIGQFDVISFNKVLEHVEDPIAMLVTVQPLLSVGGIVYVELPDAEGAAHYGSGREEFFIEHCHVFSAASTALMGSRAGFAAVAVERLREPSGKFTVRAFFELPALP